MSPPLSILPPPRYPVLSLLTLNPSYCGTPTPHSLHPLFRLLSPFSKSLRPLFLALSPLSRDLGSCAPSPDAQFPSSPHPVFIPPLRSPGLWRSLFGSPDASSWGPAYPLAPLWIPALGASLNYLLLITCVPLSGCARLPTPSGALLPLPRPLFLSSLG